MNFILQSWQMLLAILVGWVSRRQQEIIDFQNAQLEALLKAHAKKRKLLSRMIFFGEKSLRRAVTAFLAHFHTKRNHQGLGNGIIEPGEEVGQVAGKIECRERLGGLLRYYHRRAA